MTAKKPIPNAAHENAQKIAEAVEAALAGLNETLLGGFSSIEHVAEQRIRLAAKRLVECAEELARSPLLIPGSTGQQRSHPLVKVEQDLRREIVDALEKLSFRATNRSTIDKYRPVPRAPRDFTDASVPVQEDMP
jgi:hypothetical protein